MNPLSKKIQDTLDRLLRSLIPRALAGVLMHEMGVQKAFHQFEMLQDGGVAACDRHVYQ